MATALVVVAALASGLPSSGGIAVAQGQPPGSVVADDVRARVQREGRARVIVEVALPGRFRAEGDLTPAGASAQRADIGAAGSQVLDRLRGRAHRILHHYDTVPFLALEIGPDAMAELEASPDVRRVVADSLNHPLLPQSGPLVEADQAWSAGSDGSGVTVAILDTGVQASHLFFGGRVVEEACYSTSTSGISVSFCPSGQSQQTGPGSAVSCSLSVCYHGTHVAGIAAGNGATAGQTFSGMAKGASIMAVQVFAKFIRDSDCGGLNTAPCALAYTSDIIKGLERVYALRATYTFSSVNLSLGGGLFTSPCDTEPEKPIIDNLRSVGIATVIAAGNNSATNAVSAPGCISSAVSVGSTTKSDAVSSFSNMASFVSLLAPGSSIYSSVLGNGFNYASGTSMATPHVTGAFALLKDGAPGATVDQMLNALQTTGLPITDQRSGTVTKSRIRVADALAALAPPAPSPTVTSVSPSTSNTGTTLASVLIGGTNFQTGATASFGAGITVTSVTVNSSAQITAAITIASSATPGSRTVTVTNPGGLSGALSNGFTVVASLPDLTESGVGNPPATVTAGASFGVSDTVSNLGLGAAAASTTRYYLSTDQTRSGDDVLLAGSRSVSTLAAGGTSPGTASVTVPAGTSGTFFLLACADDTSAVAESNESNNCAASATTVQVTAPGAPDLIQTAVTYPPGTAGPGDSFSVTDTVTNQGTAAAGASTTRYYLSLDLVRGGGDVLLSGTRSVPGLSAGAPSQGSVTVTIPGNTGNGSYYLLACSDDLAVVAESNEANNCVASSTTMQVKRRGKK